MCDTAVGQRGSGGRGEAAGLPRTPLFASAVPGRAAERWRAGAGAQPGPGGGCGPRGAAGGGRGEATPARCRRLWAGLRRPPGHRRPIAVRSRDLFAYRLLIGEGWGAGAGPDAGGRGRAGGRAVDQREPPRAGCARRGTRVPHWRAPAEQSRVTGSHGVSPSRATCRRRWRPSPLLGRAPLPGDGGAAADGRCWRERRSGGRGAVPRRPQRGRSARGRRSVAETLSAICRLQWRCLAGARKLDCNAGRQRKVGVTGENCCRSEGGGGAHVGALGPQRIGRTDSSAAASSLLSAFPSFIF